MLTAISNDYYEGYKILDDSLKTDMETVKAAIKVNYFVI